jgi:hypothetical protein
MKPTVDSHMGTLFARPDYFERFLTTWKELMERRKKAAVMK